MALKHARKHGLFDGIRTLPIPVPAPPSPTWRPASGTAPQPWLRGISAPSKAATSRSPTRCSASPSATRRPRRTMLRRLTPGAREVTGDHDHADAPTAV